MGGQLGCVRARPVAVGQGVSSCSQIGTCTVPNVVAQGCGTVGNLFFEPEGSVTTETWQYVGEGKGGYSKLQTYSFVGDGNGTFDKQGVTTNYGGSTKRCCTGLFILLVAAGVAYAVFTMHEKAPKEVEELLPDFIVTTQQPTKVASTSKAQPKLRHEVRQDHDGHPTQQETAMSYHPSSSQSTTVAPAQTPAPVAILGPASPKYVCAATKKDARVQAAIFAEWQAVDRDRSGFVTRDELMAQKATLSSTTLELLLDADVDGSGSLSSEEFSAALARSGTIKPKSKDDDDDRLPEGSTAEWSKEKRKWCCHNMGVACPPPKEHKEHKEHKTHHRHSSEEAKFDCEEDGDSADEWPDHHKKWCCKHARVGCSSNVETTKSPYDCTAGLGNWRAGWSVSKKEWCCSHHQKGCQGSDVAVGAEYDCKESLRGAAIEWTAQQRYWCCRHKNTACEWSTTLRERHDCTSDASLWTADQKAWCCRNEKHGCQNVEGEKNEESETVKPRGCYTMCKLDNMTASCKDRVQWSSRHEFEDRPDACTKAIEKVIMDCPMCSECSLAETRCSVSGSTGKTSSLAEQPELFDCKAGYSKWQTGWSVGKKAWCCANKNRGCAHDAGAERESSAESPEAPPLPPPPPPPPYPEALDGQQADGTTTTSEPFNCKVSANDWQRAWSSMKKGWCCVHAGVGCTSSARSSPTAATVIEQVAGTEAEFNCATGFATWSWGWSSEKKRWCCDNEGKGCSEPTPNSQTLAADSGTIAAAVLR
mmetsp:Transcript_535/g.1083  ORF Transcript_535/g.1083 Transcript_535/m.1083 type:complete len:761 (-) Transcript_535:69-2351(-)